jgi:ectoine hydroxylase
MSANNSDKGYIIIRKLFDSEEMAILKEVISVNERMKQHAQHALDKSSQGNRPSFETIFVWNDTANQDIFAKATRSNRIFERLEYFFQDKVYVYHNKVALKYPGVVGFSYHQDYAYWYGMGNIFPDMATIFIAIDDATAENGCLKILEGSHKMGRLDHENYNGPEDSGVALERLDVIKEMFPEIVVELASGDAVLFHGNMLHSSDDNNSQKSRLALLGCYNTKHNSPYKRGGGHPPYQPQAMVFEKITRLDVNKLPDMELSWG